LDIYTGGEGRREKGFSFYTHLFASLKFTKQKEEKI